MTESTAGDEEVPGLDTDALAHLLRVQDGVVSRRQLTEIGAQEWDVRRLLRRRELTRVHAGVYVDTPGPLTGPQRRWAAVLAHWPAALTLESALPGHDDDPIVHVAIAHGRSLDAMPGVHLHRTSRLQDRVRWNLSPPAVAIEDAAVTVAAGQQDVLARFEVFAKVVRSRRTTVERLKLEVVGRPRLADRALVLDLLDDLDAGACSVLEREWLHVERRHGLPEGVRQQATAVGTRRGYLDVRYAGQSVRVELDGRAFHDSDSASWESDHERDLGGIAEDDELTIRLTYSQVFRKGCATAAAVARVLQRRGWEGAPTRCPDCESSPEG